MKGRSRSRRSAHFLHGVRWILNEEEGLIDDWFGTVIIDNGAEDVASRNGYLRTMSK